MTISGDAPTIELPHTERHHMKTTAVLLALAIAYIAIESMPAEVAGAIGLGFITVTVIALISAIVAIGKAAR